ncbi:MAG: PAS domain S-box protein [Chitinispirillaceae bacterium]|nr:PAS domain S-box protein [Chitinispirillaceae bacterium]
MHYFYSYLHFFSAILFLILGATLLIRDFGSRLNQMCAGVVLCFFIWSFGTIWVHHPATPVEIARPFGKIATIGWMFFGSFHLCFAWLYTKRKAFKYLRPVTVLLFLLPSVFTLLQWTRSIFVGSLEKRPYGWFTRWNPTPWPTFYFVYLAAILLTAFWLIFDHGRKSDNVYIRRQSVIIIVSGLISLLSGFLINIFISIVYPEGFPPIGDVTSLLWAFGLTYVAIRYNILNITPFIAANRIIVAMKDLLFLLDTHGYIISVNRAAEQVLACRADQITGRHFSELIAAEGRSELPDTMLRQSEYTTETVVSCANGPAIPVELFTSLIPGTGVVCVAHNISLQRQRTESLKEAKKQLESRVSQATEELRQINQKLVQEVEEKKLAVDAMKESEERFRVIFEYAPDGICLLDREGNFITGNNELVRITGYAKSAMVGKNLFDFGLLSGEDTRIVKEMINGDSENGIAEYREFTLTKEDTSEIPVEISSHQLRIAERTLNVCIVRDLSLRKEAEKEAQELRAALHHSQKMDAIGRLAGGIAHDFNNLLGGIIGYAGLLQKRLGTPYESDILGKIIHVSKQAADRTAQLLAFARKGKYRVEPVDMHTVIQEIINLMRHTIDPKIGLTYRLEADCATVKGDRSQLHSALLNLGVNARDAVPEGGAIVYSTKNVPRGEVAFPDVDEGTVAEKYLEIVVRDNGIGMDEETISRIFEPFFSTKEEGKGTGLGLPSVYGTIKQHGGSIYCQSEPGKGTSFYLYLPVVEMLVTGEHTDPAPSGYTEMHTGTGMVLVVDDTPLIREMMEEALIDAGYSVHTCNDGNEALSWYRENHAACDLVILDYTMPDLNGKECFTSMKKVNPTVKAVLTSGHAVDNEIGRTLDAGVISFLQKPFEVDDLTALVRKILIEG